MTLPADILRRSLTLPIMVDQEIDLSKNDQFLHLGVWIQLTAVPAAASIFPLEFPTRPSPRAGQSQLTHVSHR